jgi:uncharacterized alpha-E superfamily protein
MVLLSRVATVLYVLGRDLERTEHLARLLRVHFELSLDRSLPRGPRFWPDALELAGQRVNGPVSRDQAVGLLLGDPTGPSLRRSMESARAAAQAVRPSISIEVWEQVNALYWRLAEAGWRGEPYAFLRQVELGTQLIAGLADDTMAHDDSWNFVRLGKQLERAGNVARVVARRSAGLVGHEDDPVAWASVLRCCASYETFRVRFGATMSADAACRFLLLDRLSPRSAAFCVEQALAAVQQVDGPDGSSWPHRVLGQLAADFQYAEPARVGAAPAELTERFERHAAELHRALRETYFKPSQVALDWAGEQLARHPQQQQQHVSYTSSPSPSAGSDLLVP